MIFLTLGANENERERERGRKRREREREERVSKKRLMDWVLLARRRLIRGGSQGVKVLIETVQIDITNWLNPLFVATAPSLSLPLSLSPSLSHTLPLLAISRREK
jgi:hypothetical protein